jgi:putative ABC transport system permease protein
LLAWRTLTDDVRRTALTILGIFLAVLLVFFELGLFFSVPRAGLLFYDHLRFDLMLASSLYQYQTNPGYLKLEQVEQVRKQPGVASATPLYFAGSKWQSGVGDKWPDVFLIGFPTSTSPFTATDVNRQLDVLNRLDTILVDAASLPMFGALTVDRNIKLENRPERIGGTYHLGTGLMGLGVVLLSDRNFERLFPLRGLDYVNLAAIVLEPGVDADRGAETLRAILPDDLRVFTRRELEAHEVDYWTTRASVGLIFGSGLAISMLVGIMIAYTMLATQINRKLRQFATLKAIGYTDGALYATVVAMVAMLTTAGFAPAFVAALWLFAVIRNSTMLPAAMTGTCLAAAVAASFVIVAISSLLSLAGLRRADPADVT